MTLWIEIDGRTYREIGTPPLADRESQAALVSATSLRRSANTDVTNMTLVLDIKRGNLIVAHPVTPVLMQAIFGRDNTPLFTGSVKDVTCTTTAWTIRIAL